MAYRITAYDKDNQKQATHYEPTLVAATDCAEWHTRNTRKRCLIEQLDQGHTVKQWWIQHEPA